MVDGAASRHLVSLVLAALVFSGCLDDAPKEGMESPADSTPADDAEPVEVFSPGWPDLGEAVVRPGVKISTTYGACTANFVFSTPDNHTLYLGTASHCHIGTAIGDPVSIAFGAVTGKLVYCAWGTFDESDICPEKRGTDEGWANDFALVELPDEARNLVHPALLHWGGPTDVLTSPPGADVHVLTFGNTPLRDADTAGPGSGAADASEGITASPVTDSPITPAHSAEWSTLARFASPRVQGDSGSAVILADGTALGILSQIVAYEGAMRVTNLNPAIGFLHNSTELQIELKTFQMLMDPVLPLPAPDEGAPRR